MGFWNALTFVSFILFCCVCAEVNNETKHECKAYTAGQSIHMQCRGWEGSLEWGPGPICHENKKEMQFQYGMDSLQYCAWHIDSDEKYQYLRSLLISGETGINCRIAMAPDHEFYIPFTIPIWGVVEADHIHVDTHTNFIFHADNGKIIGAAAYPVIDQFQYVRTSTVITMHGPVKWFNRHSFKDYYPNSSSSIGITEFSLIVIWCLLTCILTTLIFAFLYKNHLRPNVLRTVLKND